MTRLHDEKIADAATATPAPAQPENTCQLTEHPHHVTPEECPIHGMSSGEYTKMRAAAIALRMFTERGYDATSMREIAEGLGVSKAALYYHFKGKEDIVRGLLNNYITELDELGERVAAGLSIGELLDAWCDHCIRTGLQLARFNLVNHAVLTSFGVNKSVGRERISAFIDAALPAETSTAVRLRTRLAFFNVAMTVLVGEGLDMSDTDMVAEARAAAYETLVATGLV